MKIRIEGRKKMVSVIYLETYLPRDSGRLK
jgi:hypothetical protein